MLFDDSALAAFWQETTSFKKNLHVFPTFQRSIYFIYASHSWRMLWYFVSRFWAYNAGHVLGAAMFMIEIAGVKILYTGDFSREQDRHLMAAEMPLMKPDVLIIEATYGIKIHEKREEREHR